MQRIFENVMIVRLAGLTERSTGREGKGVEIVRLVTWPIKGAFEEVGMTGTMDVR